MKKCIMFIIVSFSITKITAQTSKPIFNSFGFHYSLNGTGDMKGFDINVAKRKSINKTFDWYYGSSLNLHFRGATHTISGGNPPTLKFQTFGIQAESGLTTKLFGNNSPLKISTSPILRFQSTTYPSTYQSSYDPIFNAWRHTIIQSIPNRLSLGYKVQLELELIKMKKSRMSFSANFQNDTRGDVITGLGIIIKN
jgi:hypothetical protein